MKSFKSNTKINLFLSLLAVIGLVVGGFFVAEILMSGENISEEQTEASEFNENVNYVPGEILVGFDSTPPTNFETDFQNILGLRDFEIEQELNSTTYLFTSNTLKTNALADIEDNNLEDTRWGELDSWTSRVLTILNTNAQNQIPEFDYAEPNYKVQTFIE